MPQIIQTVQSKFQQEMYFTVQKDGKHFLLATLQWLEMMVKYTILHLQFQPEE
ncbi:hypothetical protein D3C71_2175600 [compost metagenome]